MAAVEKLTGGEGADLVIDCVGGYDGVRSFEQAQDMVRLRGTIQLIAAYQQRPLALHTLKIMHRRLVAGILVDEPLSRIAARAAAMIQRGEIQAERMITHRFPYTKAKEAFDFDVALAAGGARRPADLAPLGTTIWSMSSVAPGPRRNRTGDRLALMGPTMPSIRARSESRSLPRHPPRNRHPCRSASMPTYWLADGRKGVRVTLTTTDSVTWERTWGRIQDGNRHLTTVLKQWLEQNALQA